MFFAKIVKSAAALTLLSISAQAQMMMSGNLNAGTGMWGGTQQCPYQTSVGNGAVSMDDGLKEIQGRIAEQQKQLKQKQSEQDKLKKQASRAEKDIEDSLESDHADFVIEHISNNVACEEYDIPMQPDESDAPIAQGQEGQRPVKGPPDHKKRSVSPFTKSEWAEYCKPGNVVTSLCDNAGIRNEGTRVLADKCKKGISAYKKSYAQSQKLQSEIERLKDDVENTKQELKDARQELADNRAQGLDSGTESAYCAECALRGNGNGNSPQRQTDWNSVAANGITAVAATVLGYSANKSQQETNASLGFPTYNQYPSWGFGLPYAQAAVYGALGGGTGQGSFGCGGSSGNMSAGGAFGYPSSMMAGMGMNSMGGGMFMPGMGMNGMMGDMGMNGYGNMMGGMMSLGGMMNSMMGNSMMGGMTGNMMGYGNMMSAGGLMNYGSVMGNMMGNTMMGGMTGNMMGYGSLMGNSMMGTMMGTGSLMSMGGLTSYGSLMGSSAMMSSSMDPSGMQEYAHYQSAQMAKYSQLSSLQQEMSSLAMRMQMIQSSAYTGYGTGASNYLGYSGGTSAYGTGLTNSSGTNLIGISAGGTITQGR
jgi:hypothetical protein